MRKVLYADDEVKYRNLVKLYLESKGYQVILAENGKVAIEKIYDDPNFDVIILDLMMPEIDGFEACKIVNKEFSIPVIMLTALGSLNDEINGIKIGADDYITKPFSLELLYTRLEALLRRKDKSINKEEILLGLKFFNNSFEVKIGGKIIQLTPKEFQLLKYLVSNKGLIFSRYKLLDILWGYDYDGDPRTVDTHIKSLRSKLGTFSNQIVTIRYQGYYYKGEKDEDN